MSSKEIWKERLIKFLKYLRTSAALVVATAAISIIYAFFTHGRFWLGYIFTSNLALGGILIGAGLVVYMLPFVPKKSKLLDHTTYAEKLMEAKETKNKRAYFLLYIGIGNMFITMIVQYVLSLIWV